MILKREILTFVTRMKPNKCKAWIRAARPQTLAASVSPVLVACALAYRNDAFQWIPAVWCMAVAVLAQIAANFFNDYFDFKKGTDTEERLGQQQRINYPAASRRGINKVFYLSTCHKQQGIKP